MQTLEINFALLVIFLVYGLTFFIMGVAMLMEVGRSPLLAEARVLRPLAAFGILHGTHEWIEFLILQAKRWNLQLPAYFPLGRLIILTLSFLSLIAFGVQVLRPPRRLAALDAYIGFAMLVIYLGLLVAVGDLDAASLTQRIGLADTLARYILAVPGGILAAVALRQHARRLEIGNRRAMNYSLGFAALGFALYALTQIFVSPAAIFPARIINSVWFNQEFGFPIQAARSVLALGITAGLIRATQIVEKERQYQLLAAQQARLEALERVREELVKREALRRELLRHTVIAQEQERARISRELHDETAQTLTAFRVNLAALQNRLPDSTNVNELITRLHTYGDEMAKRLHRLVHDLHPAQLDDLGLVPALQFLTDEVKESLGLKVDFSVVGNRRRLESLIKVVLYRIAQEAMTNTVRHAGTLQVKVELCFEPDGLRLTIQDHGRGFDLGRQNNSKPGLGLAGMQERAASVGGSLQIESAPNQGTRIQVWVPEGTLDGPETGKEGLM